MATKNLCVRSANFTRVRCKKIAAVTTLKAAKQLAYRVATRTNLYPGSHIYMWLQPLGRSQSTRPYVFVVEHGIVRCRHGSAHGRKCD